MDKQEIFYHFSDILDNLIDKTLFFPAYLQNPYPMNGGAMHLESGYKGFKSEILYSTGVTRGCLIDEDYDWVVKFDIDEDVRERSMCEQEQHLYKEAVKAHLEAYFNKPVYLGVYCHTFLFYDDAHVFRYLDEDWIFTKNDMEKWEDSFLAHEDDFGQMRTITVQLPLFAYRKADTYYTGYWSDQDRKKITTMHTPMNSDASLDFIAEHGIEEYSRLNDFFHEHCINDVRLSNIGSIDGHMVIIDYAGFFDDEDLMANFHSGCGFSYEQPKHTSKSSFWYI